MHCNILTFLALLPVAWGASILVVVPLPAKSHQNLFDPIVQELARRGHQVTYISAFQIKNPEKNVKSIVVPPPEPDPKEPPKNFFEMRHFTPVHNMIFLPMMVEAMSRSLLNSTQMQKFLKENNHFDAIIVESFLTEAIAAGLSQKYKAPLIGYGTFMPSYWVNYMVGNEAPTSYIPDPFLSLPSKMNIFQRLMNFIFVNAANLHQNLLHIPTQDKMMREFFGQNLPYVRDIISNTSILFVNDHYSISFPRPTTPNLISIGGVHVLPPKPLPADLQKYLDESKKGAIFFSFGSNLKSAQLGEERIQIFMNVFSKLEQNVLWKFEAELPNKPKNVLISDWFPQSDILAHPNLKLFITHGGLLSTTEAVHRAVPLVGIPVFGDQPMNMEQSVNAGVGLKIDFDSLSEEGLLKAIKEVLNNPKYAEAAKARSKAFTDVPKGPLETAIWWIEYVIRNKGAPQLRSAAQDLACYQRLQLDVLTIILTALILAYCLIKTILEKSLGMCRSSKSTKIDKKKKKN